MPERKPFKLGFSPAAYNRAGLRAIAAQDPKALQREYARLRREAQDRLRGFARSAELHDKPIAKENRNKFVPISKIKSQAQLETLIIDAARFVTARSGSVSGYKAIRMDKVNTLRAAGYTWINTKNIEDFGTFMDWTRAHKQDRIYSSGSRADIFRVVAKDEVSSEDLKKYFNEFMKLQNKGKKVTLREAKALRKKNKRNYRSKG